MDKQVSTNSIIERNLQLVELNKLDITFDQLYFIVYRDYPDDKGDWIKTLTYTTPVNHTLIRALQLKLKKD